MQFISERQIILASGSPRRRELLGVLGLPIKVLPSNVEENVELIDKDFNDYVQKLAVKKAAAVANMKPDAVVIAADTIVVFKDEVYPKPATKEQAETFLKTFSGKAHSVFTGVSILGGGKEIVFSEETKVVFKELDDKLIKAYVDSGDPMDKAGGYGIQTAGVLLVDKIEGDYSNVVGLPLAKLVEILRRERIIQLKEGE
ncbi:nucleoside triphosphate pyrophosphatase [Sporosarcina thermotolerans]|uniref:dTTP/UTP pyrophosphatase n=2 Tax=Sporosarcina thermotolerans TaxID=633404 RepID=A0AAW9ADH5_9BACL|nr:nucleoside triphosphate pyrophosphatase [Sporosarcina thermotolerans]MDW0118105.1 nucleoside triphosphate pyrophosphatase [Sporosarcina thermotolerans]WHT47596.1 nucleoside triphosphate pyrophosphatase [Sporosarcina thermotolerans]